MKIIQLAALIFLFPVTLFAQNQTVFGTVFDDETGLPVPNATIRISGTKKGTYSKKNGTFRIAKSQLENNRQLRISSLGYKTQIVDIEADTLNIRLKPTAVEIGSVEVIGEINPEEVVRRAIAKKKENAAKIKTVQCLLYSKLGLDTKDLFGGAGISINGAQINDIKADTTNKELTKEEKDKLSKTAVSGFLTENFAVRYVDKLKNINKAEIVQRRQTANFPTEYNIITLQNFIDFSENEVQILDAYFITPLNDNALSYYKFNMLERKLIDDKYVYIIEVIPDSHVFPTFQGTIGIIEGTYNLIEVKLKPSEHTKVQFVEELAVIEKFEEIEKDIWYPAFYEFDIRIKAQVLLGMRINAGVKATGILSDIKINQPLPDSVYRQNDTNFVIAQNVDSSQSRYWEIQHLTPEEEKLYADVDTAVKKLNINVNSINYDSLASYKINKFDFSFYWPNYINTYNRATDYITGGGITLGSYIISTSAAIAYCTGLNKWMGNARIDYNQPVFRARFKQHNYLQLLFSAEYFSNYRAFASDYDSPDLIMNALNILFFNEDYYNYYESIGWNAKFGFTYKQYKIYTQYEHFSVGTMTKTTDFSLFTKAPLRDNPAANDGNYSIFRNVIEIGDFNKLDNNVLQYKGKIGYQIGKNRDANYSFSTAKVDVAVKVPLFEAGYGKMNCVFALTAGIAEGNTPVQEQFAIRQASILSPIFIPVDNSFLTSYGLEYGGTEFYSFHINFNLRDWWWRAIGLPLIYGRGLELCVSSTNGRYFNKSNQDYNKDFYKSTDDGFYSEVGVGLGRIPIFISEFIYWSIEARFGIGHYAKDKWGFLLNFNLPF